MKAIAIIVNVIYYLSLFFMWYKIYLISRHLLKTNKEHVQKRLSTKEENDIHENKITKKTDNEDKEYLSPIQYDKLFIRKHGKDLLIAVVICIITLFITGFVL